MVTKTQQLKYKARLQQSQSEKDTKALDLNVEKSKLRLQSDKIATSEQLLTAKSELEDLKNAFPLEPKAIIEKQDEIAQLESGLKALEELESELF